MTIFIYLVIFFMEAKKKLIMDAWIKLFWKNWPRKTSVDQIVNEAWIAKGTFYLYFKNKEELYEAIINKTFSDWKEKLEILINDIPGLRERIIQKMILSLKFFEKDDIMRNILFWNTDYDFWYINKKYIENLHIQILKPLFKNNKELDYNLILKIMWFYVNVINIKPQFINDEEYNNFVLEFAWVIVNWICSDYKQITKDITI